MEVGGPEWQNALEAFKNADAKSRQYADQMLRHLELAELVSTESAREFYERAAKRALLASENYRKSAELAQKVLQEIATGLAGLR